MQKPWYEGKAADLRCGCSAQRALVLFVKAPHADCAGGTYFCVVAGPHRSDLQGTCGATVHAVTLEDWRMFVYNAIKVL